MYFLINLVDYGQDLYSKAKINRIKSINKSEVCSQILFICEKCSFLDDLIDLIRKSSFTLQSDKNEEVLNRIILDNLNDKRFAWFQGFNRDVNG